MLLKQGDDVINNKGKVAEFLSNTYINVMENTVGKKPLDVTFSTAINTILYKYHPYV